MDVTCEMAATVWKVIVKPGDSVEKDDVLLILESMKMEIPVVSPASMEVRSVLVAEGDSVNEGQIVVVLDEP
ncbi:MAG: biotin/lipoyl-binding carrier protein [Acidimicrobiales bacterium]